MAKGTRPLFGVEIDGERKNLFGSAANAKALKAAAIAEGHKAVIFAHSEAEKKAHRAKAADEEFMKLGVQYYVAARSAVMAQLLPVCGNLYHHSLEMFLKAGLSRHITLDDLKNQRKFGHDLRKLWPA